jgi:hypothetical protein
VVILWTRLRCTDELFVNLDSINLWVNSRKFKQIRRGILEYFILKLFPLSLKVKPKTKERKSDQNAKISNGFTNCGHQQDHQLMILNWNLYSPSRKQQTNDIHGQNLSKLLFYGTLEASIWFDVMAAEALKNHLRGKKFEMKLRQQVLSYFVMESTETCWNGVWLETTWDHAPSETRRERNHRNNQELNQAFTS